MSLWCGGFAVVVTPRLIRTIPPSTPPSLTHPITERLGERGKRAATKGWQPMEQTRGGGSVGGRRVAEEGGYRHDTTTIITTAHKGLGVWGPAHLAKARKEPSEEGGSIGGCHHHYWNNGP